MNKLFFFLICIAFPLLSFSQKENLKAYIDVKDFYHPETGSYAEIELQFAIQSTSLKTIGDTALQASFAIYSGLMPFFWGYHQNSGTTSSGDVTAVTSFVNSY